MGLGLTGKLGRAWVGVCVGTWHGVWVHGVVKGVGKLHVYSHNI